MRDISKMHTILSHPHVTGTWSSPPTTGDRPPPCSAFSFTTIDHHRAVLFGGRQEHGRVNDIYILDLDTMVCCLLLIMLHLIDVYCPPLLPALDQGSEPWKRSLASGRDTCCLLPQLGQAAPPAAGHWWIGNTKTLRDACQCGLSNMEGGMLTSVNLWICDSK